jgi:hypothetical protein
VHLSTVVTICSPAQRIGDGIHFGGLNNKHNVPQSVCASTAGPNFSAAVAGAHADVNSHTACRADSDARARLFPWAEWCMGA